MLKFNAFYQDDKVMYVGSQLSKELGNKQGWIISQIKNEPGVYVVEFEGESYIMPESSLTRFKVTSKDSGPEIRQIRKRHVEDE